MCKKREKIIDLLKGIAIFLVVYSHAIQYFSGEEYLIKKCFFDNMVFKVIYSFHMPLFMLISGYLFFNYNDKKIDIKKQLKTLIIPIFSWQFLYSLIYFINKEKNISYFKFLSSSIIYGLWFLWAIFYISCFIIFLEYFVKNKKLKILIHILNFFILMLIPDYFGSSLYKFMYPFFIIGYYNKNLEKLKTIQNNTKQYKVIQLVMLLIYLILLVKYESNFYIYTSGYYIFNKEIFYFNQIYINIYRFIIGLIGSLLIIFFVNLFNSVKNKNNLKLLEILGKNSLGIYILTGYGFEFISKKIESSGLNYFYDFLVSCILIIISLIIIKLIKKVKILNILLLGGRK